MRTRIVWTAQERATVKAGLVEVFKTSLTLTRKYALRQAQMGLPFERRRRITDQVGFYEQEMIESARNAARTVVHAEPETVCRSPYCECSVGECKNGHVDMRGTSPAPRPAVAPLPEPVTAGLGATLEQLIDLVADRVWARIQSRLVTEKASASPGYDAVIARANAQYRSQAPSEGRAPRVGVLICGIRPHQGHALVRDFPALDITCYDSDEARTKAVIRRAHTFLLTRFLSHQVDERFKGSTPNLHRLPGGYSELREELTRLAATAVLKGVEKC